MAGWREVLAMTIKKKAIYKNMVSSESPGHTVGFFSSQCKHGLVHSIYSHSLTDH